VFRRAIITAAICLLIVVTIVSINMGGGDDYTVPIEVFHGTISSVSEQHKLQIVMQRSGGASLSHLPLLSRLRLGKERTHNSHVHEFTLYYGGTSSSSRPVISAYALSNSVYRVELKNFPNKQSLEEYASALERELPKLRVIW
jgi:hypothetical protein